MYELDGNRERPDAEVSADINGIYDHDVYYDGKEAEAVNEFDLDIKGLKLPVTCKITKEAQ